MNAEMLPEKRSSRSLPAGSRRYVITELRARHQEIVRLLALGTPSVDVAEALGITPTTVSNVANSPVGKSRIAELQGERDESIKDVRNQIRELAPRAIALYEQILEADGEEGRDLLDMSLRKQVADQILDRGGIPRETSAKVEASISHHITEDSIEVIKARAIEIASRSGLLIDVNAEEISQDEDTRAPSDGSADGSRALEPCGAGVGS
jgi:predicted transcriptional regulator